MIAAKLQCLSHTPLMGLVDPASTIVQAAKQAIAKLERELNRFDPEVIFLFAPDHFNGFFYDLMPQFCIGTAAQSIGDFGSPPGSLNVPRDLAQGCAEAVLAAEVDSAISHRMQVDHGFAQPLQLLAGGLDRYPVIPIFINCVGTPLPTIKRARRLGEAVGRFASTLGKRVLFLGSGGLSHNPPVPSLQGADAEVAERLIAGRNPSTAAREARQQRVINAAREFAAGTGNLHPLNPEWDKRFIELLQQRDFDALDGIGNSEISQLAGNSGHEVKTWVAANAAMSAATQERYEVGIGYYQAIPEWIAGFATLQGQTNVD